MPYKGKSTTRGWATLPPDIIRLILTHFLLDFSASAFLPQTWAQREHWMGRMVYNVVRDTEAIEKVMSVAPTWGIAIEYHLFWQHAIAVLDPSDQLLPFARQQRCSPYKHYRYNLYQRACIPCRVNQAHTPYGLCSVKRQVHTLDLGDIPCCKDHRKERLCGICLRDAFNEESGIAENEDTDVWPRIEATCRACRSEWLWRQCLEGDPQVGSELTKEAEAVGGRSLSPADWEARQSVEAFVEMGEGTIRDVITVCIEKQWLRRNTKISEMLNLVVATSRLQSRISANTTGISGGYGRAGDYYESEEELSEIEADEDDEDPDFMSVTEDAGGVRELAINDWARTRILEGHWFSPADQWHLLQAPDQWPPLPTDSPSTYPFPYTPARHPCHISTSDDVELHPSPTLVRSSPPPSLQLCSTAYDAFKRQLRLLLTPAMLNIVRRIVMECAEDGTDPCVRVTKMGVEDVVEALRDSGTWYNGLDWLMRRREDAAEQRQRRRAEVRKDDVQDDTSSSSKSGSQTTSPVLSTSTLQTTPSPPPASDGKKSEYSSNLDEPDFRTTTVPSIPRLEPTSPSLSLPIAVSPVLDSPTQIPSIPYIPVSLTGMPPFTIETIKAIWRDACAPLFHCRCKICERAVMKANIDAGIVVPSQAQDYEAQGFSRDVVALAPQPVQVHLEMVNEEKHQKGLVSPTIVPSIANQGQEEDQMEVRKTAGRKRSCEALDYVDENGFSTENAGAVRETTPPKRQRTEDSLDKHPDLTVCTPIRLEKRRSEELGDTEENDKPGLSAESAQHKKVRIDSTLSKSTPLSPILPLTSELSGEDDEVALRQPTPTSAAMNRSHS